MTRSTTQICDVTERLDKRLINSDRLSISTSLAEYMVKHSMEISDLKTSDTLLDALLPRIANHNSEWKGIVSVKDIHKSPLKKRINDHIQN